MKDKGNWANDLLEGVFGSRTTVIPREGDVYERQDKKGLLQKLIELFMPKPNIDTPYVQDNSTQAQYSPTATPTPSPTPTPSSNPKLDELIRVIQEGSAGDPVATMAAQMVNTGKDMPVFQENPFLPVAISQLESRGLKDFGVNPLVTKPKQGFGWAPGIAGYNPPIEKVLEDMMSAIGTSREGEDEVRRRNASYYEPFRQNPSDIKGFAKQYAGPVTKQNPNAGDVYASNLMAVMNKYAELLDSVMQERGASYPKRY